jgi:hypothetical protein
VTHILVELRRPPRWIQALAHAIDRLEFGAGFAPVTAGTRWSFGVERGVGSAALQELLHRIDDPLITVHQLLECWSGTDTHIVRGVARVRRRVDTTPPVVIPFVWILSTDALDPPTLRRIDIVNGPLNTDTLG